MNNVTFVEAARFLAERMIKEGGQTPESQLVRGFRLATGRYPNRRELEIVCDAYARFHKRFKEDSGAAERLLAIGEKPRDKSLDAGEHAAFSMVASALLNLDEMISKE